MFDKKRIQIIRKVALFYEDEGIVISKEGGTMVLINITQEELVRQLMDSAEQMLLKDPEQSYEGLVALRALLIHDELKYDLVSVSADLTFRVLTLVWLLQRFVNGELWRNFGPGNTGFPETQGKPLIHQISYDLGRFILRFLNEGEMSLGNFISVMERYFQLLSVTEQTHVNPPDPETRWITL